MFKFELYFLVDGKWIHDGYDIRDRCPEKDDEFYLKGTEYRVVDIKEHEDHDLIFDVFLDF